MLHTIFIPKWITMLNQIIPRKFLLWFLITNNWGFLKRANIVAAILYFNYSRLMISGWYYLSWCLNKIFVSSASTFNTLLVPCKHLLRFTNPLQRVTCPSYIFLKIISHIWNLHYLLWVESIRIKSILCQIKLFPMILV